ncbi:pyruvate dehydrogenase complex dihydrolipoamide acetyltransferase [Thauera chlorobenzoica]|uniref:Acetyltransferase component of pyruvate dehydrogenase complex n=2 Tax=Thauera chlorobenzoica TaxID=96773 RepID=A0A1L6FCE0_9RHOO|nr:pyruvate dehydrogenase complex dihydrolipoamide acetyltransferase [Thauera chlorobenzoica]APR04340.1 benzoquinone dehydrogenase, small subunit BqdS [Thauera chlorobenzoica]
MPSTGASMSEGSILRWLKQEGEAVERGEALFEIETDKAVAEAPAPACGILGRILAAGGSEGIKVDSVVGLIAVDGEDPATLAAAVPAGATPVGSAPAASPAAAAPAPAAAATAAGEASPAAAHGRIPASPLARRLARETGVDLSVVRGRGPHGRVLRADVESAARQAAEVLVPSAALAPGRTAPLPAATVAAAGTAAPSAAGAAFEDIPHSAMRRVIAQRLGEAKRTVPHFYLSLDCTVDALLALRAQLNAQLDAQLDAQVGAHPGGGKLSVNDFIVKAVALALRRVPGCNAAWTEAAIRRFAEVDVAVAVATPGGLITPIVRHADDKSLGTLSAELRALAGRAREGRLKPEEYQGGGFTVSNLGMYGIREFAAIINPPQACILAVGACEPRPVVRDGSLAVATLMSCTLSVDHRVVDGALAAEFLAEFRRLIENPLAILV